MEEFDPTNTRDVNIWKEVVKGKEYLQILKAPTSIITNKEVLLQLLRFHPEQFKSNALFDAVKSDTAFMLEAIGIDPTFIEYVGRELLFDEDFKEQVASVSDEAAKVLEEEKQRVEMIDEAFKAGELAVVAAVIAENVGMMQFMTDEMKNDYELMSLVSKENEAAQDYITINKEDFGIEGIRATRDNVETESKDEGIEEIVAQRNSEDKRFAKVADKIEEVGIDDPKTMRYMVAMLAQAEVIDEKQAKRFIEYAILQMETTYRGQDEKGRIETSLDDMMRLLPKQLVDRVIAKSGVLESMPELAEKVEEYKARVDEYSKQYRVQRREKMENKKNELSDNAKTTGIERIEQMRDSEDTRFARVADKIKEVGTDDPKVMRYMTAILVTQEEVDPNLARNIYEYAQLQVQTTAGKETTQEDMLRMIPPTLMRKVVEKSGIASEIGDAEKKLEIYERNYQRYQQKERQRKAEKRRTVQQQERTEVRITQGESEVTVDKGEVAIDDVSQQPHIIQIEDVTEAIIEGEVTAQGTRRKAEEISEEIKQANNERQPQKKQQELVGRE